jgi:hypothetical protein
MPKNSRERRAALRQLFAASAEEWTDPAGLRGLLGPPGPVWTPRLTPFLTLLQELLADVFAVRDRVRQAQTQGCKLPSSVRRQYEQDLQWLSSQEEQVPFSFGWVCVALGLDTSAVRRRYLSGQAATLKRRYAVRRFRVPERLLR